jgi:hypothetical protein
MNAKPNSDLAKSGEISTEREQTRLLPLIVETWNRNRQKENILPFFKDTP